MTRRVNWASHTKFTAADLAQSKVSPSSAEVVSKLREKERKKKEESKQKADVKGKGKEIKNKEITTGKLQVSPLASSISPPRESSIVAPPALVPERLALGKAGEAQRFYDERKKQIDEDHELALRLEREEQAELEKEREKEESTGVKKKVLRKVGNVEEEDETQRKEDKEILSRPPNTKAKILKVSITPKSKKVPETLYTFS